VEAYFGAHGALARSMPGFQVRPGQRELAEAVARAIAQGDVLFAEAGTGTGKTLAYLVPALTSGRRVVVSTGTRNLQDQLFDKDLPLVREALGQPVRTALLKGRSNYLCIHRLEQTREEGRLGDRESVRELARVMAWSGATDDGDLAGCDGLREDSPLIGRITSSAENCLGNRCAAFDRCHVVVARQRAIAADLVVVNHHLLLSDLALKEEGFGDLLGEVDAVVVDEAHRLPELCSSFFGHSLSGRQFVSLGDDVLNEAGAAALDLAPLVPAVQALGDLSAKLRESLQRGTANGEGERRFRFDPGQEAAACEAMLALDENLAALDGFLAPAAGEAGGDSAGVDTLRARITAARALLDAFVGAPGVEAGAFDEIDADLPQPESLCWVELTRRGYQIHLTPIDAAAQLQAAAANLGAAWIMTSATLSVAGDFTHFGERLGLDADTRLSLPSPFDPDQALLVLPAELSAPGSPRHTEQLVDAVLPLLEAAEGRAFMLFTSYAALDRAARELAAKSDLELLVQGSAPRDALLNRFKARPGQVLLGTASFWEGVDVRGDALSLVVIDKLPFAAPGDPLLAARLEAIERAGGNGFAGYQLPQAVLALRQGVGRLLRDEADRGVIVIGDPRLSSKGYGRVFLNSLPAFPRTRDIAGAAAFLRRGLEDQASPLPLAPGPEPAVGEGG
jgi:ATP-dependent DNA helicase DinG